MMKRIILLVICLVFFGFASVHAENMEITPKNNEVTTTDDYRNFDDEGLFWGTAKNFEYNFYRARVHEVTEIERYIDGEKTIIQEAKIEILNRDRVGEKAEITNTLTGNEVYDLVIEAGTIVTVHYEDGTYYFVSYDNIRPLIVLGALLLLCLVGIGGIKGIKSVLALITTLLLIIFFMVPLLLQGVSPIIAAVLICGLATIITFAIIIGLSRKALAATLGTIGGLLLAGTIAYFFGAVIRLTGFSANEATMLFHLPHDTVFDFKGLLFAGIVIGALGATMDVAISIASALTELQTENPQIERKKLISSGFNVGRDVMGTMINTLVLAYIGGKITVILLFVGFQISFYHIISLDFMAAEFLRAAAGSIGLLFAIPCTIIVYCYLPWDRMPKLFRK